MSMSANVEITLKQGYNHWPVAKASPTELTLKLMPVRCPALRPASVTILIDGKEYSRMVWVTKVDGVVVEIVDER